ncbi:hypothetical protein AAW01_11225 [Aurantiacibacter gangjinensis]|uniref:Uncharacterized protein n=2 Tax=Aurantiacibacter gangjinensis TaxID=502682 RepID=A0A0G9MMZ4_9SPHN|nr:hypothetical protein AAW01_11225 [Aurantiacibacter gangjinensis]
MRDVELGITLDEFRTIPIPNDDDRYTDLQAACTLDDMPLARRIMGSSSDQALGIAECQWFSKDSLVPMMSASEHWINIGQGRGQPLFRFIESDGNMRLFEITFYANNQYHPAILDALSRGYGAPQDEAEPFITRAGGEFTSVTSIWDNGSSTITLTDRCRHLERYCLTYEHKALASQYDAIIEAQADEAASRI